MSGNSLTILSGGTFVRGDVYSQDVLVIEGGIEGNIVGNRVIVKPQGWVHGDLTCRSLSIEPGGVVDGAIKVSDSSSLPSPAMVEQELLAGQEAPSLIEVAGIVGEVAARIFGQTQEQTTLYAHKLGLALQLTNVIRDVGEDALRGRIYLPMNEMQQFDVKAHEILKRTHSGRFVELMQFQTRRAYALYDEALALLPTADRRSQKPGLMMASIYRALLGEIERDGFQVLQQRVSLTPLRKLWLAWKVQALGRV